MMKAAAGTLDRLRVDFASRSALVWTLRVGACMCFVGHGAFGIITKRGWLPYFAVANIAPDVAYRLMPVIGTLDITLGILMLVMPIPAVGAWMTVWAVWTALLRPFSGESMWEAVERAGNYGVPVALLLLFQPWGGFAGFVKRAVPRELDSMVLKRLRIALTAAVVLVLVGHGMLGLMGKPGHVMNYASVMSADVAPQFTRFAGAFEILLAAIVAIRPSAGVLLFVAAWKLATESLFVTAGSPAWEIVERGGSYASPIALAIVVTIQSRIVKTAVYSGTRTKTDVPPPILDSTCAEPLASVARS
jgi:hypothetical protein